MGVEVGVALAGASLIGSLLEGSAQEKALKAQAKNDEDNAKVAARAATDAAQRGDYAASQEKMKAGQVASAAKVAGAASGVETSTGTPAKLIEQTRAMGDLDALMTTNNAAAEAYGYAVQKGNLNANAKLKRDQAGQALPMSLLTGVTRGASMLLPYAKGR